MIRPEFPGTFSTMRKISIGSDPIRVLETRTGCKRNGLLIMYSPQDPTFISCPRASGAETPTQQNPFSSRSASILVREGKELLNVACQQFDLILKKSMERCIERHQPSMLVHGQSDEVSVGDVRVSENLLGQASASRTLSSRR